MKLDRHDLTWALRRMPKPLKKIMALPEWENKIFVGGGFLRSIVAGEKINDIDVFVSSKEDAKKLADLLSQDSEGKKIHRIFETENALTVKTKPVVVQIIHRWLFATPESVSDSFDFTCCCAVIYYKKGFDSYCDERFYIDIANKRLVYRSPIRNEDAGGSMLRVLKYYQKGYRIPLDSLGDIIARLVMAIDFERINTLEGIDKEKQIGKVITGLLREVDPNVDPEHLAHLPTVGEELESDDEIAEI